MRQILAQGQLLAGIKMVPWNNFRHNPRMGGERKWGLSRGRRVGSGSGLSLSGRAENSGPLRPRA